MPSYFQNLFEQVATAKSYAEAYALCGYIVNGGCAYAQSIQNHFNVILGSLARKS
jgi:hypothetical protein